MKEIIKKYRNNVRFNTLIFLAFITCIVLIYSTYAWFSSTLDVKISDFKAVVDPETGLYISLDGIRWGSTVEISEENIIDKLKEIYPSNTNQWSNGLTSVSTIGLKNSNDNKFSMYGNENEFFGKILSFNKTEIDIVKLDETKSKNNAEFIAFDIFIKNLTTSPYSDNLYLVNGTKVINSSEESDDTAANAFRIGLLFMGSVHKNASIEQIQNIQCNPICYQHIYEPNSKMHTEQSIKILEKHNYQIIEGKEYTTYAVYNSGKSVQMWSGVENSSVQFNYNIFKKQETNTSLNNPVGQIPSGITKVRIYIWVEGQDIDIIEQRPNVYKVSVTMNFEKDMAGYE